MEELFTINELESRYPFAVKTTNGVKDIDYKALSLFLVQELNDIQDQLIEKDFQILKITEKLDKLKV